MNSNGSLSRSLLTFAFLVLLVGGGLVLYLNQGRSDGDPKDILIPRKSTLTSVVALLEAEGVIQKPVGFKWLLRLTRGASRVRAGEFRFRTSMSPLAALQVLYHDEPIVHTVTIPEGWNAHQIAEQLASEGLVNKEAFLALVFHPTASARYKLTSPSLEGFLYPETYTFSRIDGPEKILDRFVQVFFQKVDDKVRQEALRMGWTLEQIVTLASIIEKETGTADERALISSVFHNRLKKRMRLQSDPTTIYGIANFDGNLTKKHLQETTPYNTYKINGLPPGPIASPGIASIRAALAPASTEYLYFVANNRGSHIFSKTYEQHNRYVKTYQGSSLPHAQESNFSELAAPARQPQQRRSTTSYGNHKKNKRR